MLLNMKQNSCVKVSIVKQYLCAKGLTIEVQHSKHRQHWVRQSDRAVEPALYLKLTFIFQKMLPSILMKLLLQKIPRELLRKREKRG